MKDEQDYNRSAPNMKIGMVSEYFCIFEKIMINSVCEINRGVEMKESSRYLQNAKEILSKAKIEDKMYVDIKYVQEACGTAYFAVLKAINEYLFKKGVPKRELSRSIEGYRKALQKYLIIHNGKLLREFDNLYHELHIAGYYAGDLRHVDTVKSVLKATKSFIEKIDC